MWRPLLAGVIVLASASTGGCGSSLGGADGGPGGSAGGRSGTGTAGSGGGEPAIVGEIFRGCPDTPPDGYCDLAFRGVACVYETATCVCGIGGDVVWRCDRCPDEQPTPSSFGGATMTAARRCRYGDVSCSWNKQQNQWSCGICPAARPQPGVACGNAAVSCAYGDDTCVCQDGEWTCATATCATVPLAASDAATCTTLASYTCAFSTLDQKCSCGDVEGASSTWRCSCPGSVPRTGEVCAGPGEACAYGGVDCECVNGRWDCKANPCPPSKPAAGSACSSVVNCTYNSVVVCSCDGATWSSC